MPADAREIAERYFVALGRRDLEAAAACWAPDGVDDLVGIARADGPTGVRAFFGEVFAAFRDFAMEARSLLVEDDRAAVRWHATGTFAGDAEWQGIAPTGDRVTLDGLDLLEVRDGLIVRNEAFSDGLGLARRLGLLPPPGSKADAGMLRAFNARTAAARKLAGSDAQPVADGVWLVRGGLPREMNVYLIADEGGGVTVFDAGARGMARAIMAAATGLGGINRIVLGHAHADHRGSAGRLGAPIHCHPADRADAEGDGGLHYMHLDRLPPHARLVYPSLLRMWDGGPVEIAGTIEEGDEVSGFRVVHMPGHAPGQIALFRERDGLALTSDVFYTLDVLTGLHGRPRVAHDAFNQDTAQARASVRKLAGLAPAVAWPGHAHPLRGDVAARLERAAAG
jgi:glyoxylase-like metal-dependent hydrolase (beta-lactamase superfamily II)/ketosteroid isomerase-like protein